MRLKKVLSVFLAVVMLFSAASVGLTAVAAEINYDAQYRLLALALKKEHVRDLTNYTVTSDKIDNGAKGYVAEVKGFSYDHRVTAADNTDGDILNASNRFYYIAETLMSYTYGVGCYDAKTLIEQIAGKIKPHFDSSETIYEDFSGNRYNPTAEELEIYNALAAEIEAEGGTLDQAAVTEAGLFFMERDAWEYYNVESVLKYFAGNATAINSNNWYHRYSFIVETSVETCLQDFGGLNNVVNTTLTIRTAVYQFKYQKLYNESASKAYFAFDKSTLQDVFETYGDEFGLDSTSADLTKNNGTSMGLLRDGQAANFLIKVTEDKTTVQRLLDIERAFDKYVTKQYNEATKTKWDDTISGADYEEFKGYAAYLTGNYSNDTLVSLFGDKLGNMVTLTYLLKPINEAPTRVVRGEATYTATPAKINRVINSLDNLVSSGKDDDENSIANRVAGLISLFLDVGGLLGAEGIEYESLEDLIGKILQSLVFSDSIINMLVELLYPMISDLIETELIGMIKEEAGSVLGDLVNTLLEDILDNNKLAVHPKALGELLSEDYGNTYKAASDYLRNGSDNWADVDCSKIVWGVDTAPVEQKQEVFLNALCAALGGFTRLLVVLLCGDYEYRNDAMQDVDNFGKYFDLALIGGVWITSQGMYTKLFIPLYRVLGLDESDYLSAADFHAAVVRDRNVVLREAVRPIITWVTEYVAKRPFETIMKLVPNLVNFLSRTDNVDISGYKDDWTGKAFVLGSDNQENAHKGYSLLQTKNLVTILDNIYISISVLGMIGIDVGSIASLIGGDTLGMLTSLNALLNEVIGLAYETDIVQTKEIVCYTDIYGNFYFPGDEGFEELDLTSFTPHLVYYSNDDHTKFSLTKTEECPNEHTNYTYVERNYYLPTIPEAKLLSCGTKNEATNTITVNDPGQVFLFLLRYVLSAVGYKFDVNAYGGEIPSLIECFGLDLESELFAGFTLGDIINNVMLHPDEAICALLELFSPNEEGNLYEVNEAGNVVKGKPYTYPVQPIEYYENTLLNKTVNPTLTYGTEVRYSQYWTKEVADDFIANLTPLAEAVVKMIGLEGAEDGIGPFLENLLKENVFNNDLVNTLFNTIYQLIANLNDMVGLDLEGILDSVLDVSFAPSKVATTLRKMAGDSEAVRQIATLNSWLDLFTVGTEIDEETGEEVPVLGDVELDWGIDTAQNSADAFLRTVSALLSPAAFLLKFLFMDQDLDILGLVHIPGYAGYQYAFIGLLELLTCPDILTYEEYYKASLDPECGDANVIYYLFAPLLGLIEKVYVDPVNTVLSLIPNLFFFISIGGLNDFVNNLIHFAYVLLDILKPILNGYDLLDGLLANLEISGFALNLSIPLNLDFNSIISELLGSLVGDVLTIEGVSITLPHIDLYTLCVGTLERFNSKEGRVIAHLNASGGGELLTALLRIVFDVLFMEENHVALSQIVSNLAGEGILDEYDEETLYIVINTLLGLLEDYEVLDIVLYAVYLLVTNLIPIADTLAERLAANGMTITEFFGSMSDFDSFIANISLILKDPNEVEVPGQIDDMGAIGGIFARIKAFFEKIKLFFQRLFGII
ncbi:MAG: hypothetical protein IKL10_04035 [Clostridia bacterium]|nr:hypothetical protein [Clostridia bacterium]